MGQIGHTEFIRQECTSNSFTLEFKIHVFKK